MPYNVGPDFTRPAARDAMCGDCNEVVTPEWDGCEGEWRCSECYASMPEYQEQAA